MSLRQDAGPIGFEITRRNVMAMGSILAAALLEGCHKTSSHFHFEDHDHIQDFAGHDHRHEEPNCYLKSTQILTSAGYKKIEELEIGERVVTHGHGLRSIQWVGRRSCFRGRNGIWSKLVNPVKITKNAFGYKVPDADLFVSQDHRIFLYNMLIKATDLVDNNSVSIVEIDNSDEIVYFHLLVEGGHYLIYAQNTLSETLLPNEESVRRFDNCPPADSSFLHSDGVSGNLCAPLFTCNDFGRRARLRSHLRSALSPWIDRRNQSDRVRDQLIAERHRPKGHPRCAQLS